MSSRLWRKIFAGGAALVAAGSITSAAMFLDTQFPRGSLLGLCGRLVPLVLLIPSIASLFVSVCDPCGRPRCGRRANEDHPS